MIMARLAIIFVSAIAGAFWTSTTLAAGPFGTIHVGLWRGGAYTNDSTGAFSHCAAQSEHANGVSLLIGQFADHTWSLGLGGASANVTPGATFPIDIILFDGQTQFRVVGNAANSKLISAPLPDAVANRMRKSHQMAASDSSGTFQFKLDAIDKLMSIVTYCVDKVRTRGVASAEDFSVAALKPPVISTAVKSSGSGEPAPLERPSQLINVNATGIVISTRGHVVTNNHVINGCVGDVHGNLAGEPATTLRIVSKDETNDLALLQTTDTFKDAAHIRATAVHSGDSVIAIGYPFHGLLTSDFTVTTGIVNSLSGVFNDTRYLQISAQIEHGNSGGPLLDTAGNVVGVVAEKLNAVKFAKVMGDIPQNINFAIKTGALRDFLDNSVVPYQSAERGVELKTSEITKNARAYTMLISCSVKGGESAKK
jgi:S1-C subfamily serine protease